MAQCEWGVLRRWTPFEGGCYSRERHADWNGIELIGHNQIDTKLQICFVTQKSNWTFERLGTFHSRGGDLDVWYQFGWPDAGQFKAALSVGDVWVTAFSFAPSFLNGSYIGYPPLRIHHTHVTSSHHSSDLNQGWKGFRNTEGYVGIEFDVHGDRQCHPSRGGTDCLAFAYASGFGMRLSDPLEVFGDINDVRAFGSPQLDFQLQYAFRWTSQPQTRVTKLITEIGTVQVQAGWERWGSMALIFDPLYPTEYLAWCERFFPMDGSLAKVYYHSHHMFTEDYWTVVGSARMLEFDSSPYSNREDESKANNLTQYGLTIESVKHHVLSRIHEVQNECQTNGCEIVPRLLCSIAVDWEVVVDGQTEKPYPRYRPAQCQGAELRFKNGDPLVIMSFHRDVGGSVKDFPLTVFSHTTWYAIAIPSSNQTYRNETHKGFSAALSSPQVRKIPHAATLARDLSKLRLLNLSDPQYKSQLNLYQPY